MVKAHAIPRMSDKAARFSLARYQAPTSPKPCKLDLTFAVGNRCNLLGIYRLQQVGGFELTPKNSWKSLGNRGRESVPAPDSQSRRRERKGG